MAKKKGKVLPKVGKFSQRASDEGKSELTYAAAIAAALRQELGMTHQAIKSAMRWTGASERTVKYWFSGTRGPSGQHLIGLACHSDLVLEVFLQRAGRHQYAVVLRLMDAHHTLTGVLAAIQSIVGSADH